MPSLPSEVLHQLTARPHGFNFYNKSFLSLRNWATQAKALDNYEIVTHGEKNPAQEKVQCYNSIQRPEIAAVISEAQNGIVGKKMSYFEEEANLMQMVMKFSIKIRLFNALTVHCVTSFLYVTEMVRDILTDSANRFQGHKCNEKNDLFNSLRISIISEFRESSFNLRKGKTVSTVCCRPVLQGRAKKLGISSQ